MTTPGAEELVELPFDSGAWKVGSMVQCCVRRTEDWSVRYRTWGGDCTTLVPRRNLLDGDCLMHALEMEMLLMKGKMEIDGKRGRQIYARGREGRITDRYMYRRMGVPNST